MHVRGIAGIQGISSPSGQFFCEPKTAPKQEVYFFKHLEERYYQVPERWESTKSNALGIKWI